MAFRQRRRQQLVPYREGYQPKVSDIALESSLPIVANTNARRTN